MEVVENERIPLTRDLSKEWTVQFKVNLNELPVVYRSQSPVISGYISKERLRYTMKAYACRRLRPGPELCRVSCTDRHRTPRCSHTSPHTVDPPHTRLRLEEQYTGVTRVLLSRYTSVPAAALFHFFGSQWLISLHCVCMITNKIYNSKCFCFTSTSTLFFVYL